jgi:hypothetical protein
MTNFAQGSPRYVAFPARLSFLPSYMESDQPYLAKLGGYVDGGYVVDYRSVLMAKWLISGGVGSNVQFESDFLDINPDVDVTMIDPTVSVARMLCRCVYHGLRKDRSGLRSLCDTLTYLRVARGTKLVRQYLGPTFSIVHAMNASAARSTEGDSRDVFLKLDIEGAEYSVLEDVLKIGHRLAGVAIEFHDLNDDSNASALGEFLDRLGFRIIHVNINDGGMVQGDPSIIEMSLRPGEGLQWPDAFGGGAFLRNSRVRFER